MKRPFERVELGEGIFFTTITDPKFKSNRISVNLLLPLDRAQVTARALVPFLLRKRCASCADFTELNQKLAQLYGAALDADVRKYGAYQVLNLSLQGLDDRYTLGHEPVTAQCAQLVADLLLDPYLVDGVFDRQDTELERQYLIDTIEAEINDKRDLAIARTGELMFEGEPFGIKKYGYVEDAKALTPELATRTYEEVIRTAHIEILFLGCGDPTPAKEVLASAFAKVQRTPIDYRAVVPSGARAEARTTVDEMDVNQGKLVLGFKLGEHTSTRDEDSIKLMAALYGGTPFSKLFLNVREKLSLCYYCAARYEKVTRTLLVDSGVEFQNEPRAREEILRQLQLVQQGDFTDEELENTKLLLYNAFGSTGDTLGGLENWYLLQILAGSARTPAENAEAIAQLGREDIMRAAGWAQLDTIYFLTGKGQRGEEE